MLLALLNDRTDPQHRPLVIPSIYAKHALRTFDPIGLFDAPRHDDAATGHSLAAARLLKSASLTEDLPYVAEWESFIEPREFAEIQNPFLQSHDFEPNVQPNWIMLAMF